METGDVEDTEGSGDIVHVGDIVGRSFFLETADTEHTGDFEDSDGTGDWDVVPFWYFGWIVVALRIGAVVSPGEEFVV